MIELKQLSKNFGKKQVLKGIDFTFDNGVYGLLGPNGAGKTTLIRCITLLYPVKAGQIFYNSKDVTKEKHYLNQVGYLPQKFGMYKELKLGEMMQLLANLKGIDKKDAPPLVEQCLAQVNLSDRIDSKVSSLSGGMLRRAGIAQAFLGSPDIMLFDEPTAGLDPEERLRFKNIIAEQKGKQNTILISTHIVEDVEAVCDHIAIMKDGVILTSGTCQEIEQLAQGKVYCVAAEQMDTVTGNYHVQSHLEQDGVRMVKFLSNTPQPFPSVKPTVEDGYICALKGI